MRIALLVHGLPPHDRTGVETHVANLARVLGGLGQEVRVLAARRACDRPHLSERRERREGYVVDWLALNEPPRDVEEAARPPGVARAVGEWLDRERPEVVHVHHVQGLGWGVLAEVGARGLPLVFSAHDYHAVCHRVTLLRPDLSRCDVVGDASRCTRCDLAVQTLHGRAELGDWHMGVFADQLDDAARAALAGALESAPTGPTWERALARRGRADALRAQAVEQVDLVLAPTRRVVERLTQGGVPPARLRLMPYALETGVLRGLSPVCSDDAGPLRVGFVGGLAKHKGAHVLLEAVRDLPGVELHLHGDSSDRPYVESVRARAAAVGARWHGAFEAGDLPVVLAGLDLVCVPSLWDENAPFVIREAFAAGRPVAASRLGALPESVRDGIDGLLVRPGDADAWRAALDGLARDRARVRRLAAGISAPPELGDQARELLEIYATLVAERAGARAATDLPDHLHAFQARRRALEPLPLDALYRRAADGLARLRRELGVSGSAALPREPGPWLERARDALRERRREASWSREVGAESATARGHLERELEWLRGVLDTREDELEWRRAHDRELEHLQAARATLEGERDWLRETLARLGEERDWLERERRGQRDALADRARLEEAWRASRAQLDALARHERWLRGETRDLAAVVLRGAEGTADEARGEVDPARLAEDLERAREHGRALREELAWRRREMSDALEEGGSLVRAVLARSALGRRFDTWRDPRGEVGS